MRCDSQSECSNLKTNKHSILWLVRCARKLKDRKRAQNLISLLFRTSLILLQTSEVGRTGENVLTVTMQGVFMKKYSESVEVLKEKSSSEKEVEEKWTAIAFSNKRKLAVIPVWLWVVLVFAFLLFVAGLVCVILGATKSTTTSCVKTTMVKTTAEPGKSAGADQMCLYSEEANRTKLPQFLKQVQTEYYALNPNSVAWQPDIEEPYEHVKQRYYSLSNLKLNRDY